MTGRLCRPGDRPLPRAVAGAGAAVPRHRHRRAGVLIMDRRRRGPLVFVTVGTDHHLFERLMDWIDALGRAPSRRARSSSSTATPRRRRCGVRSLSSARTVPRAAARARRRWSAPVARARSWRARAAGLRPIVVPRRGDLGEHVDDHQLAFSRFLGGRDLVTLAEEEPGALRRARPGAGRPDCVRDRPDRRTPRRASRASPTLVDELVWGRPMTAVTPGAGRPGPSHRCQPRRSSAAPLLDPIWPMALLTVWMPLAYFLGFAAIVWIIPAFAFGIPMVMRRTLRVPGVDPAARRPRRCGSRSPR